VCSGGKLRKSSQVLYRSDQGKNFLKIKSQLFFAFVQNTVLGLKGKTMGNRS